MLRAVAVQGSKATLPDGCRLNDRYQVLQRLGRGGMGSVYLVLDSATGERVALKALDGRTDAPEPLAEALLQREYHALRELAHPNVVRVFDFGVSETGGFYTMELLEGSLRDTLPLPFTRCAEIARDVCSALALLHSRRLLHRDVGARNVRSDGTGRAKLIDFGALLPMGRSPNVVGTPPAMPPEAVHGQHLDGRSDLYGVGALLYQLLTGRHAYPAHRVRELPELWKGGLAAPSSLVPGIPAGLDDLTLSLLSPEPAARPRTAGEVIDRLCALADLPVDDPEAARRAYLVTPALVGRVEQLARIERFTSRKGRALPWLLAIAGPSGSGRSRLLESCALHAEVAGSTVLRAAAGDLSGETYAVVRALFEDALESTPQALEDAALPDAELLAQALPELGFLAPVPQHDARPKEQLAEERDACVRTLRRLAAQRPLHLTLDDVERCDEFSLAVLAALTAERDSADITIALTRDTTLPARPGVEYLLELAEPIEVEPLLPEQTEQLLSSVFGDVPGLRGVARAVHGVSLGNPRMSMELAQHLVDRKDARFEHGTWQLPAELRELSLPTSLEAAIDVQLEALSPLSRRFASLLALTPNAAPLPLQALISVVTEADSQTAFSALDDLIARQIVTQRGAHFQLRHMGVAKALERALSASERRMLNEALASSGRDRGEPPVLIAHHLQEAGLQDEALDVLRPVLEAEQEPAPVLALDEARLWAGVLQRAIACAKRRGEHPKLLHGLFLRQNSLAASFDVPDSFEEVLARLRFDCGLDLYAGLDPALPTRDRVTRALVAAGERRSALPEAQRGLKAGAAVPRLVMTAARAYLYAMNVLDFGRLAELRSLLEPLSSLSPAIATIYEQVVIGEAAISGKFVLPQLRALLARLEQPTADLTSSQASGLSIGLRYHLGIEEARRGDPSFEHARLLAEGSRTRDMGAAIEMFVHVSQGRLEEAEKARARMRALSTGGMSRRYLANVLYNEVIMHLLSEHIAGLKRALVPVTELAKRHAGWRPLLSLAQGGYQAALGEAEPALLHVEHALSLVRPGGHLAWAVAALLRTRLLLQLGRLHEAHAYAIETFDLAERHELQPYIRAGLCAWMATACAAMGQGPSALEHAERCRAFLAQEQIGGAPQVSALTTCARAAIDAGDPTAFERYLAEANEVANAGGPELRAMVARVRRSVEVRGHASVPPEVGLGAEITTTARGQRSRESRRPRSED